MDHDSRKDFAFLTLAGQNVSVHTSDGAIWEGVFVATDAKASEAILLSCAVRCKEAGGGSEPAVWFEKCYIPMETVMLINAVDIKMQTGNTATEKVAPSRPAPLPENPNNMKWDEDVSLDTFEAEEKNWKQGKGWDQFAENERKFGVKSTYEEALYTTKMGKYTPAQMAEADRKAREIESSAAIGGIQQRIERGEEIDVDEGEMYSDVKRVDARDNRPAPKKAEAAPLPQPKAGSYVPPSKRAAAGPQTTPQQPTATVPPQPVTAVNAPPPPKTSSPTVPPTTSPSVSTSETPKAEGPKLNAGAKAWVPPNAAAAPAPVLDFAAAFTALAHATLMDAISHPMIDYHNNSMTGTEWFTDGYQQNNNAGGYASNGYNQQPYASGGYNSGANYNNTGGGANYPPHQGHQGGYNSGGGYGNNAGGGNQPNQQFPPQQTSQLTQYGGNPSGPMAGRGRGGGMGRGGMGQPQQPTTSQFGGRGGGMGPSGHNPTHMAPQPLDSASEMPIVNNRGGPAPVSQIDPAPETKPAGKLLKRGR